MVEKIFEIIDILLLTLVSGMYWGPWLALSRSMSVFQPEVFLAIANRMNKNMASLMTVLTPVALVSTLPVLWLSYSVQPVTFYLTLATFVLFVFTAIITVVVEVPIVRQIVTWTPATLPGQWMQLRDRWASFHVWRVVPSVVGIIFLLIAAIF